jgi:hypothetical protein
MINSMIHTFYPWSWSIQSFTPINCTNGTQDYTVSNTDVLRPLKIRLVQTNITPNEFRELALLANLSPDLSRLGGLDTITSAGYYASTSTIRLLTATGISGSLTMQLQGEYQQKPIKITSGNMSNVFAFPDHYFNVFVEGLKWLTYQLIDDPRSGGIQISKNGTLLKGYSGQYGVFMEQLMMMARTEDLQNGDEFMFPDTAMGVAHAWFPGLFGF